MLADTMYKVGHLWRMFKSRVRNLNYSYPDLKLYIFLPFLIDNVKIRVFVLFFIIQTIPKNSREYLSIIFVTKLNPSVKKVNFFQKTNINK